ncbi:MAG: hypothetical protein JSV52_14255 [Candidatus Zixiibacteriota bacterium]|nr:MAG: hypothetical protein JSV52_14255 [candidate division Zixibacteria bacterium]
MEKQRRVYSATLLIIAVLCLLSACGVTSRYRLDLFVTAEDIQKKVNVEEAQISANATLADPYQDYKVDSGNGNVAVVTVTTRWSQRETERFRLLGFDEFWRCKLFLELTEPIEAGELDLAEHSFLQLMGRYDISAEDKIFLPSSGSCVVDSINSKSVFFTIDGRFVNRVEEPLEFSGRFKVKRSD